MFNYANVTTGENNTRYNLNWPYIPGHPFTIIIIGDLRSGNMNAVLNLIKYKDNDDCNVNDKIYLYVKDPNEAKDQYCV